MSVFGVPLNLSAGVTPLFSIVLTVGAYLVGVGIQQRVRTAVANPVLIAVLLIGGTLRFAHMSYESYFAGAQFIHFLLGPATVALAVPLAKSLEHMKHSFLPMTAALFTGSIVGMSSGYGLVVVTGGSHTVALSMIPHSLTTPIAIGVSENLGGIQSRSAVLAIAGGILVAVSVDAVLGWVQIDDSSVRGLATGVAVSVLEHPESFPDIHFRSLCRRGDRPQRFDHCDLGAYLCVVFEVTNENHDKRHTSQWEEGVETPNGRRMPRKILE